MIERLRAVRKKLGLNQWDFARQIGLTQTTLSMIELGKIALIEKNIKLICVTFNVNEHWLRTGQGEMFGASSPYLKELTGIFDRLTADTQEFLLDMARNLLKKQEKSQGNADSAMPPE
jgi:transcriptional regulator with XRE-family HTH domain